MQQLWELVAVAGAGLALVAAVGKQAQQQVE